MKEKLVFTKKAVAQFFSVTTRTIGNWHRQGMPRRPDGGYDLLRIQIWRDHGEEGAGARQPELPVQRGKDYQEERLKRVRADLVERELAILQGKYLEISELESLLTARATAYKTGMVNFEHILPPRIAAALGLPPERQSLGLIAIVIHEVAHEVLSNVLRALILPGGQPVEWEAPRPPATV